MSNAASHNPTGTTTTAAASALSAVPELAQPVPTPLAEGPNVVSIMNGFIKSATGLDVNRVVMRYLLLPYTYMVSPIDKDECEGFVATVAEFPEMVVWAETEGGAISDLLVLLNSHLRSLLINNVVIPLPFEMRTGLEQVESPSPDEIRMS
jgi:hypothetical protein